MFVLVLAGLSSFPVMQARAQTPAAGSAAALQARHAELQPQLQRSVFGEPLVLSSRDRSGRVEGDVYAEVPHPHAAFTEVFRSAAGVCELLFLHLNVRGCTPSRDGTRLTLLVGPKRAGLLQSDYRIVYSLRSEVADATHLRVSLGASEGPLGTHDYRMVFESVPIDDGHSFVHFGYAYGYGTLAKLAMDAYLATAGRDKIGFTVESLRADGRPRYLRGERAAVERNVMRYYLALMAHRAVTTGSPAEQMQARLRAWFALTERHAAQLHEYDLDEYLHEKRRDLARAGR